MTHTVSGCLAVISEVAASTHLLPWWAVILPSLGLVSYICRQYFQYKLAKRALDKAPAKDMAVVMTAINQSGSAQRRTLVSRDRTPGDLP
jgi:hypothetical protein